MEWDKDAPLARIKGETTRANTALYDYALMGKGRSLFKLWERYCHQTDTDPPPTRRFRTLKEWSTKNAWQDRVAAFQSQQDAAEAEKWKQRQLETRQAEWDDAQALRKRADQMEQFPLAKVEQTVEYYDDGRPKSMTIVQPAGWNQGQVARNREMASKLARLAAEMATDSSKVDLTSKGGGVILRVIRDSGTDDQSEGAP